MEQDKEIRRRFWQELAKSPYLMIAPEEGHQHSLPMTAQLDEHADHCFGFYTTQNNRLASGGAAMAQFVAKGHDLFACIAGFLHPETDPAVIDRYWSAEVEAWYPGGRNDPNLLMLRFDLAEAEIWLAEVSVKGVFKRIFGGDMRGEMESKHVEVTL